MTDIYNNDKYKVVVGDAVVEGTTRRVYKIVNIEHDVEEQATYELHKAFYYADYLKLCLDLQVWKTELEELRKNYSKIASPRLTTVQ